MPTVSVPRDELFRRLGREYSASEFGDLCFSFGVELDEIVEEPGEDGTKETFYKIEVPANRYDLLCTEGIARALNIFNSSPGTSLPSYRLDPPTPQYTMTVKKSVHQVRPFVVCGILRGVTFTKSSLASFIDHQDKLHRTLCRRRTLVAIGTHDLSKITPPFFYDAREPSKFSFTPLGCDKEMTGKGVMDHFSSHLQLKAYLPIIESSPVYPLMLDSKDHILSLPPIINAEFCKVTPYTKDVFIECTATDITKAQMVLNTVVAMFSEYCAKPFTVEPVKVVYEEPDYAPVDRSLYHAEDSNRTSTDQSDKKEVAEKEEEKKQMKNKDGDISMNGWSFPIVKERSMLFSLEYIRRVTGHSKLTAEECGALLSRMMLRVSPAITSSGLFSQDTEIFEAFIPITRSDIMHQCDIAEDVAIAYGYGNLPVHRSHILPLNLLNSFSDKVRNFFSTCGYNEALTFLLISSAENYTNLGKKIPSIPSSSASATPLESLLQDALLSVNPCEYQLSPLPVRLMNSKTREFEHARTSLIPGILKSICANKGLTELPMKLFEVGDVCLIDRSTEVGARNLRYCCAAYADEHSSGLEEIHGVLDGLMKSLNFVAEYTIAEMESAVATAVAKGTKAGGGAEETGKKKKEEDESLAAHHLPQTEQLQRTLERMQGTYKLVPSKEAIFLPGRQVHILASRKPTATDGSEEIPLLIGVFGILHPHTLKAFNLHLPVSVLELNLEAFTKWLPAIDLMGN